MDSAQLGQAPVDSLAQAWRGPRRAQCAVPWLPAGSTPLPRGAGWSVATAHAAAGVLGAAAVARLLVTGAVSTGMRTCC